MIIFKLFFELLLNYLLIYFKIDNKTRWSSTYNMIYNFISLYKPINTVISISRNKAFKGKNLLITENEIKYLNTTLNILKVFVKATNKLQGDKYPTLYYTIPLVYQIYNSLDNLKLELKVSFFLNFN